MRLFDPITIRGMTLKNRITMAPMEVGVGYRSKHARAFYAERARGGVGAIIPGAVSIDLLVSDEAWERDGGAAAFRQGLHLLTEDVHQAGAKIGLQLCHAPRYPSYTGGPSETRGELVAPSARIEPDPPLHSHAPPLANVREVTVAEIEAIVAKFAKAARVAKEAGFDFVEFHSAHGYLPCQFFSPLDNRRTDKYGGDLARRMRFGLECVAAIRTAVGYEYPIFCRIGAVDDRPGGIALSDSIEFAIELEKATVDVIDVSTANPASQYFAWTHGQIPTPNLPMGTFAHLAAPIKRWLNVPVITVGRINAPGVAEGILAEGKADLIAIGRQLIADPFWPQKAQSGKLDDIVPCLSCNVCRETGRFARALRCAVNASAGREAEIEIIPTETPKKVLVVGGGPAGMEVARVAALRGHRVILAEKGDRVGGQLIVAGAGLYKDRLTAFVGYLIGQLRTLGVEVKLNTEVDVGFVEETVPDVVILALGAIPSIPDIVGVGRDNVVTAVDVLAGRTEVGEKSVIIGGGMVGCETAEVLIQKSKRVAIIEVLDEIGKDIEAVTRFGILQRLSHAGVRLETKANVEEITDRGVKVVRNGAVEFFEADSVVLATGSRPNNTLINGLQGKVSEIYAIGDCVEARKIVNAIDDGARVGRQI